MKKSSNFCVLPFYSEEVDYNGHKSACCLLPENHDIKQIQADLLADRRNSACSKCWVNEDQGLISRRQQENAFLDYKLDRDIDLIEQDCRENRNEIVLYQLKTSNLCNQACVSCNVGASSKWAELNYRAKIPKKILIFSEDFKNINYKTAQRINLMGGEPLFDPKTFDILQQLIDAGNTDCLISFVTNGSVQLKQHQLEQLKSFNNVNICISIDGTGPVFEYLRWPGVWAELLDNIKQYQTITSNISVSLTVSSLNIMYYEEIIQWFEQEQLPYNHNVVTWPQWLDPAKMPVPMKQTLAKRGRFADRYCAITGNEVSVEEYRNELLRQDQLKNIDIKQYLPEVWAMISGINQSNAGLSSPVQI